MLKYIPEVIYFIKKMKDDKLSAYAAQSTLFVFLSFMPFLMLLITLIKHSALSEETLLEFAKSFATPSLMTTIEALIDQLYLTKTKGFFLFSIISLLWASGKGFVSLIEGLNTIFDIEEHRGYIRLRLYSIVYTLVFIVIIIICIAGFILASQLLSLLNHYLPILGRIIEGIMTIRSLVSIGIFTVFFTFLYITIPYRHTKIRRQLPGAFLAALGWTVFSYGFSVYVKVSKNISLLYGGLTSLIMIILWLYICMYIFLIGAELNHYLEEKNINNKISKSSDHTCS